MLHGIFNLAFLVIVSLIISYMQWMYFDMHWIIKILLCILIFILVGFFVHNFLLKWTDFMFIKDKKRNVKGAGGINK